MDVQEARKFLVRHWSSVLVILLVILLVISLTWNVRQSRLIEREHQRTIAMDQAKVEQEATEAARARVRQEKKAAEAVAIERMQQLYREVDNLSQISEGLLRERVRQPNAPSGTSNLKADKGSP